MSEDLVAELPPEFELPPLDLIQAELQSRSLSRFIKDGWPRIDPDQYTHNWHIDTISEHLEAVNKGQITGGLLLNFPPRHMKSIMVGVGWPAWTWQGSRKDGPYMGPQVRFLAASYAQTLSVRDSVKCRRLIESEWYRQQFPGRFKITSDQNTKVRFDNDKGGYRLATSVDGSATGEGGDLIIIDDPHNAREILSQTKREGVIEWWRSTMSTRRNQTTGVFVVVMQRLHEDDLSGHILTNENGWTHICLPARYEPKHPYVFMKDPRTKEGELLWPLRFGEAALAKMEEDMGPYTAAGQLQQRPAPRKGGLFEEDWFEIVEAAPADVRWASYWDVAAGAEAEGDSDKSCNVKLGIDPRGVYYVARSNPMRKGPLDLEKAMKNTATQDGRRVVIGVPQDPGAAGKAMYQHYVRVLNGYDVRKFIEGSEGDKVARAIPLSSQAQAGNVKLVKGAWNRAWLDEVCLFPNSKHDDQMDATSGAYWTLLKGVKGGAVKPAGAPVSNPYAT